MGEKPDPERTIASSAGDPAGGDRTAPLAKTPASQTHMPTVDIARDGRTIGTPASAVRRFGRGRTTFSPGESIADRYRVVRFIAQGGMGEVYEVEDLVLHERVALKTVLPEVAEDEIAIERFKREIQLARRVSHPNVCRIFDIGQHGSDESPVLFLTMELLQGETLADHIRIKGKLSADEARPLVRQMGEALAAAHAVGIVHRDFKSNNVMLVRGSGGGVRAVVTDFGLARGVAADQSLASLSGTGQVVGTPAYMAPEQVEGGAIGPPADVYALGVVVYELLTGRWPFEGETPFSIAAKRLSEAPVPIRLHVPDLPAEWEDLVVRCLERRPEDRFPSASEVLHAIQGGEVAPSMRLQRVRRRRAFKLWGGVAIGALLVGAGLYGVLRGNRSPDEAARGTTNEPPAPAPVTARPAVAVVGFKNLAGKAELDWLSTALAELLAAELAAGEKVRTIPGESVEAMRRDLALAAADGLAAESLGRIRGRLGSDWVVTGSYLAQPGEGSASVVWTVRLQDARTAETQTLQASGVENDLLPLVADLGTRLRDALGLAALSPTETESVRASFPSSPEAARLYAEGLDQLRRGESRSASEVLARGVELASDHPLLHSALSRAWSRLGYEARAREEAALAARHASALGREQRLVVEARHHETTGRWDQAIAAYQGLFAFYPDNVDYGLDLASAQISAGHPADARTTITALRRVPPPAGEDPRIDLAAARVALAEGDVARLTEAARTAVLRAEAVGGPELVARALLIEADGLLRRGDASGAERAYQRTRDLARETGERYLEASAVNGLATVAWSRADLVAAEASWQEARQLAEKIGNRLGEAAALANLALVAGRNDELDEARSLAEKTLAIFREIGDEPRAAQALNNLANILADLGDRDGAMTRYREALEAFRHVGHRVREAQTLSNLGLLERGRGELARARRSFEDAARLAREAGDRAAEAQARVGLAGTLYELDETATAAEEAREARLLADDAGDDATATDARLALARARLAAGRASDAASEAKSVADFWKADGWIEGELEARLVLAEALDASGGANAAVTELDAVARLADETDDAEATLRAGLARAHRARITKTSDTGLVRALEKAARKAEREALPLQQLELELAIARLEPEAAANERLARIRREATERGFKRIARDAAETERR